MQFLKTDYSHISFFFWNRAETQEFPYECTLNQGVTFTGRRLWHERNLVVFSKHFYLEESQNDDFLERAMDRCGTEYSNLQNLGTWLATVFALTKNVFGNGADASNCSELIYTFRDMLGFTLDKSPDLVTPRDIVEALRRLP